MAAPDPLSRIRCLYHFTDRRNLSSIRRLGLLPLAELDREKVQVPAPASDENSREGDRRWRLDGYIHLCFRDNSPMEFVAKREGRIGETLFLQIDRCVLFWEGVRFTRGMANRQGARLYSIDEARTLIDFDILYPPKISSDPALQTRLQAAEKYEILVPERIPVELIRNLPSNG